MMTSTLHVFKDTEFGIESRVLFYAAMRGEHKYGVSLVDTDAGETLPVLRFFEDEDKAIQYAKTIARVAP